MRESPVAAIAALLPIWLGSVPAGAQVPPLDPTSLVGVWLGPTFDGGVRQLVLYPGGRLLQIETTAQGVKIDISGNWTVLGNLLNLQATRVSPSEVCIGLQGCRPVDWPRLSQLLVSLQENGMVMVTPSARLRRQP